MKERLRVHVLYEHVVHPHSSGFVRLLQPLTHLSLAEHLQVSQGVMYERLDADIVVVDRLWHPELISLGVAKEIVNAIHLAGARFIYALDDNFFDIPETHTKNPTQEQLKAVDYFLRMADMVWVTTSYLRQCLGSYNANIWILPNCLDERLLVQRAAWQGRSPFKPKKKVIGYMGTLTHDDDLMMILPALQEVCVRHPEVEIQVIGVAGQPGTRAKFQGLPVRFIKPRQGEEIYPNFMLWYTSWVNWDIAIAPLRDTYFNRAKSDIKFLDYSVIGAAGIYSDVDAYSGSVIHKENGWLVINQPAAWEEAFETLLNDPDDRIALARKAQEYVFTSRILKHRAMDWLSALRQLLG